MYELFLTSEAYDDLVDIQNYTFLEYGENQWKKYNSLIDDALKKIKTHPLIGHIRNDLPPQYLAYNIGQHVLIYRISETTIYIIRVLHQKMNFYFHFE